MKKLLFGILLLTACGGRYVRIAKDAEPKTVMISVPTVVVQTTFTYDGKNLIVSQSTVTAHFLGSGVLISPQGHILTCAHLFSEGKMQGIDITLRDGHTVPATLLYSDTECDLALVKINEYTPSVRLAQDVRVGEEVMAIGNPLGLDYTVTHGIVSNVDREDGAVLYTQTDAPINAGNSGGPLFNMNGELVGINARHQVGVDGLAFAISIKTINEFLNLFRGLNQ